MSHLYVVIVFGRVLIYLNSSTFSFWTNLLQL